MNFLKMFFSSCLGTIVGIFSLLGIIIFIATRAAGGDEPSSDPNSVLKLTFSQPIPEHTGNSAADYQKFSFSDNQTVGLHDILALIDIAKDDDNIKGIYMELKDVPVGLAGAKKIREKLDSFKQSGKFVMSYSTSYSQTQYYLASAASKLYLNPMGEMSFTGFSAQIMYYQGLMEKLGVKAQIYYAGKFKSATEPFRRKDMSPENRIQVRRFLSGMYDLYLEQIAQSRNMSTDKLFEVANTAALRNAQDALALGFVDSLVYKDQVINELKSLLGIEEKDKIKAVTLSKYYAINKSKIRKYNADADAEVAVVIAEGSIVDGEGENGSIGGDKYARVIREIRQKDKVKAIVLRINSGGGSALASDIIWRELELAKKQGIHVVASMGDVAASGGYYIASGADKIFAQDNTITGSIGVFGMVPNMRELYEKHLGLTMDTVRLTKYGVMGRDFGMFYEFTPDEGQIIQESVDSIYYTFKKRVSVGREMSMEDVDSIAQGRVWLGLDAKEIGLVDEFGGLDAAIAEGVALANLENYNVKMYPKVKTFRESLMEDLLGDKAAFSDAPATELSLEDVKQQLMAEELGIYYPVYQKMKEIREYKGPQMRVPFEWVIQ